MQNSSNLHISDILILFLSFTTKGFVDVDLRPFAMALVISDAHLVSKILLIKDNFDHFDPGRTFQTPKTSETVHES